MRRWKMANNTIYNLEFSHNWNVRTRKGKQTGKLDCACFSTIRMDSPKYAVGQVCRVILKGNKTTDEVLGYARIQTKKVFERDQLTDGVSFLDTGYNRQETLTIMSRMYANSNPRTPFCFCILKYLTEKEIEAFANQTAMKIEYDRTPQ
jgi:hypothetical protein